MAGLPINLRTLLWVAGLVVTVSFKPTTDRNMNGETHIPQPTPHGQKDVGNWFTEFRDYPGGVEYFEVWDHRDNVRRGILDRFTTGTPAS